MEVETREVEEGTEITVHSDERVALVVHDGPREEIYLPGELSSDSAYYVEQSATETHPSYIEVVHRGDVDDIELITSS